MRIGLGQIDTVQGDVSGNRRRIEAAVRRAVVEGADVVILPELALCGYCPRDLLLRTSFRDRVRETEEDLAASLADGPAIVFGSIDTNPGSGRPLYNVAAVAQGGRVTGRYPKALLPNYDVFDEARYFEPGASGAVVELAGTRCGITVCEDIWAGSPGDAGMPRYDDDPPARCVEAGAEWILNLAASPFNVERPESRDRLVTDLARRLDRPVVMVNLVGGNDELLFDGHSLAVDARGRVVARARGFEEDVVVFDAFDQMDVPVAKPASEEAKVFDALVMGTRDYARKSGFTRAVLGLSGGIDSAVVAVVAAEALGAENVTGVAMPSRYNASMSEEDAAVLASNLGLGYRVIPIEGPFKAVLDELAPVFEGRPQDVTEENVQPRLRGLLLMALSNKFGSLLLSTGNKSELAVGYCTLYGDMCGGLAVISDLPKTLVYRVARHVNERAGREVIPERTITRPPSAELRPDQEDTDSLPDYDVLDDILARAIEHGQSVSEIAASGHDETIVRETLDRLWRNEYKRKQMPPGLRVTTKAFGTGRRMPITGASAWLREEPRD